MNRFKLVAPLAIAVGLSTALPVRAVDKAYAEQVESWRAQRVESLKAPGSWLSLVGLHWIAAGENTLGSADDNRIVLARGPAHLGSVTLTADGTVTLRLLPGTAATVDGKPASTAVLLDDSREDRDPSVVQTGTLSFYVIDRDGRKALRATDTEAETRSHFAGLDYFPIDPGWRVVARWEAFDAPRTLDVPTVLGTVEHQPVSGRAVFERDGKSYALTPYHDGSDPRLFFVIRDTTSGKLTYAASRFLKTEPPKDGRVILDFNEAYNPPCAFTPYATCPIAPPENRLKLAITAGELKYRGGHD